LMKVIPGFPTFRLWASPDEGYSKNSSCALNWIFTFLLTSRVSLETTQCCLHRESQGWIFIQIVKSEFKTWIIHFGMDK
jgi:hypothetical protein